jgi:hypothetical protein
MIMIKKVWMLLLVLSMLAGFSITAHAALTTIGTAAYNGNTYKLIYEDDQGLIWLDYSFPNTMWPQQMKAIAKLNEPGTLTYKLNSNVKINWRGSWRLPLAVDDSRKNGNDGTTSAGCNITTSEIGHLFYKSLGNLGFYDTKGNQRPGWGKTRDQEPYGLKNTSPFENLRYDSYWTGTEYSINPVHAWDFNTYFGVLDCQCFKSSYPLSGLAVRPAVVDIR